MRTNIIHPGADELTYEIREIVEIGKRFELMGVVDPATAGRGWGQPGGGVVPVAEQRRGGIDG